MKSQESWDWQTPEKQISVREWQEKFNWVEDFSVSPDGEKIAAIVNLDEMEFGVCENGDVWEENFEKAWSLRHLPDGRTALLVAKDEEWSVCVDGACWETWFDYVWDLQSTPDGSHISVAVQIDGEYGMAVNDTAWENRYESISNMVLSETGSAGAVVQVEPLGQGDIQGFANGIFSLAVNGEALPEKYMNIWDLAFDSQGKTLAGSIRKTRTDYGIVNGSACWNASFQSAWRPLYVEQDNALVAPVKTAGKWMLYKDAKPLWGRQYEQVWKLTGNTATGKIAAVVCDSFANWTVCDNGADWQTHCDTLISSLAYSDSGRSLVATFKNDGFWDVVVNDRAWGLRADKLWAPVLSEDDSVVATRMEEKGRYYLVVNGTVHPEGFDQMFEPAVSPAGDKIMIKAVKDGMYYRRIIPVDQVI